ncbi:unnamed protein product [Polarella glacialis]|uniref:Uncharacterized protein n=1 Tax=Polarella glacialis TaxID=89957 RepID=A0A813K8X2_POLGL|nr:unnamed protein product [Polarella glacialis]
MPVRARSSCQKSSVQLLRGSGPTRRCPAGRRPATSTRPATAAISTAATAAKTTKTRQGLATRRLILCLLCLSPTEGRLGSDSNNNNNNNKNNNNYNDKNSNKDVGGSEGDSGNVWATGTSYLFSATTTRYGHTISSCGSVNTSQLVDGLDYTVVASAQSMQTEFVEGECSWECTDGQGLRVESCAVTSCGNWSDGGLVGDCSCRQVGNCWCGLASSQRASGTGTAALGCFTCAKGRFLKKQPYSDQPEDPDFASPELNLVVADICPYGSNAKWCPGTPGATNVCGERNHLDFTATPEGINNNFFVFSPAECSDEIKDRFATMSHCVLTTR